jgi:PrpF protein
VRGGTSKGVFIMANQYPNDPAKRDAVVLAVYGSPDVRQIDGLGGSDVLTSKHAIISPSTRPDADVDYTFGQVSIDTAYVDYRGNCGNISSAVGPFVIDEGMVEPVEPITTVRIRMTNSNRILVAEVPVKDGKAMVDGDYAIDGVPGTGAKIAIDWSDVVGGITGKFLPTGNAKDIIEVDGVKYPVSIADAGNPVVFINAASLKMKGTELPNEIESNKPLLETIEKIRGHATVMCGLADKPENAISHGAGRLHPRNDRCTGIGAPEAHRRAGEHLAWPADRREGLGANPDGKPHRRGSSRCLRHGTAPALASVSYIAECRGHPTYRVRHARKLSHLLQRCRRGHPGVARGITGSHVASAEIVRDDQQFLPTRLCRSLEAIRLPRFLPNLGERLRG